jgi:hypothetical protein
LARVARPEAANHQFEGFYDRAPNPKPPPEDWMSTLKWEERLAIARLGVIVAWDEHHGSDQRSSPVQALV